MRPTFAVLAAVAFGLVVLGWHSTSAAEPEKYALLVGVTKYRHAEMNRTPLKFPEADANAVGDLLRASGYQVDTLLGEQATRTAIQAGLAKLSTKGNAEGVVLIGLFGHGVQYGDDAYFGGYDTSLRDVLDAGGNAVRERNGRVKQEPDPASMIDMKSVLDALARSGAGNRALLADCCREDPSAARGRAFGSSLRIADLPAGTAALFACSEGEKAFEHDDWGHGAFTRALLDRGRKIEPGRRLTANALSADLHDSVDQMVRDKTDGRQRQRVNPIVNGIVDLQLSGEAPRRFVVSGREAQLRREKARRILQEVEPRVAAAAADDFHLWIKQELLAWNYARLGDRAKTLEHVRRVEDVRAAARILGVIAKAKAELDLSSELQDVQNRPYAEFEETRGDLSIQFLAADDFSTAESAEAMARRLRLRFRSGDVDFDVMQFLMAKPGYFAKEFPRDELRAMARRVPADDDTTQAVVSAFAGDVATVRSALQSGDAWMTHIPHWVAPFIERGEIETLNELFSLYRPPPDIDGGETQVKLGRNGERWLAAEMLLSTGRVEEAHRTGLSIELGDAKAEETILWIASGKGRAWPGCRENDLPTSLVADVRISPHWHTLGRLDEEAYLRRKIGELAALREAPDVALLLFVDGLLRDVE